MVSGVEGEVVGDVPFFGFEVALGAEADSVFGDVSAVGHFVPVGDVVCVEGLGFEAACFALVLVALEDGVSEMGADLFFGFHEI